MKRLLVTISILVFSVMATGCNPSVSEEQLGEIQYTMPEVPGGEEPYSLPEPKFVDETEGSQAPEAAPEAESP